MNACWCKRIIFHRSDLNFKSNATASLASVWEKSNITDIFYICLTMLAWTFFMNPFSNFISAGNRSSVLAPKFEILLLLYFVFCIFVRTDYQSLYCKFHFLEKQKQKQNKKKNSQRGTVLYLVAKYLSSQILAIFQMNYCRFVKF